MSKEELIELRCALKRQIKMFPNKDEKLLFGLFLELAEEKIDLLDEGGD